MADLQLHQVTHEISHSLRVDKRGYSTRVAKLNGNCESRPIVLRLGADRDLRLPLIRITGSTERSVLMACVSHYIPRLARSLLRGYRDARRQARSSASIASPYGLRFPSAMNPP